MVGRVVSHRLGCRQSGRAAGRSRAAVKVVLAGNIGKFSLMLRQPFSRLSLQTRRMTDDDPDAAFAAGGRPGSVLCWAEIRSNDL